MGLTLLVYGLLPLVVFVIVDLAAGVKWAVLAAILGAFADIFITRRMTGAWDPGSFVAFGLMAALGVVTLRLDKPVYVKLQPTVMAVLYAALLVYLQLRGGLGNTYLPLLAKGLPPEMRAVADEPWVPKLLDRIVWGMVPLLLVHGALCAVAAYKWSNVAWLLVRGVGFWVLVLLFGIALGVGMALMGAAPG